MLREKIMSIPSKEEALVGRSEPPFFYAEIHHVNGNRISGSCPGGLNEVLVGMGCFWGAERKFWNLNGVYSTAVGYAAGHTENPTYEEVCSGLTGHNEVVRIWYNPELINLETILAVFWENHDSTQGMRQGNDVGTQYRSGIYVNSELDKTIAEDSLAHYQQRLHKAGYDDITTEILSDVIFYPAESYHQQYLAKNPNGYCGLGGCDVAYSA